MIWITPEDHAPDQLGRYAALWQNDSDPEYLFPEVA
jgi:hypothetical protein